MTPEQVATRMRTVQEAMGCDDCLGQEERPESEHGATATGGSGAPAGETCTGPAKPLHQQHLLPPSAKPNRCRKGPEEPTSTREGAKKVLAWSLFVDGDLGQKPRAGLAGPLVR